MQAAAEAAQTRLLDWARAARGVDAAASLRPDEGVREAAGKPATGVLHLDAYHRGGSIVIEVSDDGAGLNRERILAKARSKGLVGASDVLSDDEVADLIFLPGFSTAEQTTDLSVAASAWMSCAGTSRSLAAP